MLQSQEEFLREINQLSIAVGEQRCQKDARKQRKCILRKMKNAETDKTH